MTDADTDMVMLTVPDDETVTEGDVVVVPDTETVVELELDDVTVVVCVEVAE